MTTDIVASNDRPATEHTPARGRYDRHAMIAVGVLALLILAMMVVSELRKPVITIGSHGTSIIAEVNALNPPGDSFRLLHANYLRAIDLAEGCHLRVLKGPSLVPEPSYQAARNDADNTGITKIVGRVYAGDVIDTRFGTHCTPAPGKPAFDKR
jgi:hypothetical protein